MIVDVATYRDGRRHEVPDLAATLQACRVDADGASPAPGDPAQEEFLWLG